MARLLERLGSFARLIRFDKRGTGLSDRTVGLPDFESRMDDGCAVMDAAGSERAIVDETHDRERCEALRPARDRERVSGSFGTRGRGARGCIP
jgi:hypothetical protein